MTNSLKTSPRPNVEGMDMLYRQLEKIQAITATQLVECA
jgi:hypothetical protein